DEGNQMDLIHTDEVRFPIDLEDMGANIINAFISIEDERFEKHKGVDYKRTIGVTLRDVFGRFTGNRDMQGGSTLTQQMIKNTFLTRDQKYERKIKEIFMALEAEKKLTKDQILETYLNSIYLGGKANGVEAAARQYFSKSAKDLNIVEAAYIAGATQSPSVYYAFGQNSLANPSKYINRTILVLDALLKNGKITEEEHKIHVEELEIALKPIEEKEAYVIDLDAKLASGEIPVEEYDRLSRKAMTGLEFHQQSIISDRYNYEYFTRPVEKEVKADLIEIKGYTVEEANDLMNYGGLVIHSTMNRTNQDYAQSILADYNNINTHYIHPYTGEDTEAEAAFSALDYHSGHVKVLVGGRDNTTPGTQNRAYYSKNDTTLGTLRPIGSTTKPLLIYSPGLETGAITLATPALDKKIELNEDEIRSSMEVPDRPWPSNVDFRYTGNTTIRKALTNSYNTVSARTYYNLGNARTDIAINFANKYGLILPSDMGAFGASYVALGSNEAMNKDGGNPLILSEAYGTFGNNGVKTEGILYTKVTDSEGNIILENIPRSEQIISSQNAYLIYDIMKDVVKNNVPKTKLTDMPIAGKTGTSTKTIDAITTDLWFAGLSPYYSSTMWIGTDYVSEVLRRDSNRSQISYATQIAYGKIMAKLHEGLEVKDIPRPSGLVTASFCNISGGIPNEQCYTAGTVDSDLFVSGTQPTEVCTVHTYVPPVIEPLPEPETPGIPGIPTPPTPPTTPVDPDESADSGTRFKLPFENPNFLNPGN
ncbi:MAG: hypothetical protein GX829_01385, partial [Clostridium sp.]|nr:hypothetical protein [Clostridium sp.]